MKIHSNLKKVFFIIIIINIVYIFISQQFTIGRINKEILKSNKKIQKLSDENQGLKDQMEMSKKDKYIEDLARERCKFIKKGEVPIIDKSSDK